MFGKFFSGPDTGTHILATIVVGAFVAICVLLIVHPVSETPTLTGFFGVISAKFVSIVDRYLERLKLSWGAANGAPEAPSA